LINTRHKQNIELLATLKIELSHHLITGCDPTNTNVVYKKL